MMKSFNRNAASIAGALACSLVLAGCVFQSTYDNMLQQQQAIEASLRQEIANDQVTIQQLENGIKVSLSSDLLYSEGGVQLSPSGRAALTKVAPTLAGQTLEVDVAGNTDNVPIGPALLERFPTNWELAGERASIVVRHLQASGVDPSRMRAISAGQYHPVASNDTAAGRAQNRRTEIVLRPR